MRLPRWFKSAGSPKGWSCSSQTKCFLCAHSWYFYDLSVNLFSLLIWQKTDKGKNIISSVSTQYYWVTRWGILSSRAICQEGQEWGSSLLLWLQQRFRLTLMPHPTAPWVTSRGSALKTSLLVAPVKPLFSLQHFSSLLHHPSGILFVCICEGLEHFFLWVIEGQTLSPHTPAWGQHTS